MMLFEERLNEVTEDWAAVVCKSGVLVERNPGTLFSSASIIKLFIAQAARAMHPGLDGLVLIDPEEHTAAGDGVLKNHDTPMMIPLRLAVNLMLAVSDNVATNAVISHLGGVDAVNRVLADLGYKEDEALLHGTVGGRSRIPSPAPEPAPHLPTRWCLGAVTAAAVARCLLALQKDEELVGFLSSQQDVRSVGRNLPPGSGAWWKTGTADGLVHAAGCIDGTLFVILTDSPFSKAEEYHARTVDSPVFRALGGVPDWLRSF